jgi:hypothetical protein
MSKQLAKRGAGRARAKTIETLNVNYAKGEGGTRIDAAKYEAVKKAILKAVPKSERGIEFRELGAAVEEHLPGGKIPGGGSIMWYVTTVKLDLESRGLIERVERSRPQRVRRT